MYDDEKDEEYWLDEARDMGEGLNVDTREGSVYMDTQTGHCTRTAKFFNDLDSVFEMLAVDTCEGDILTEKAGMDGIQRDPATPSYWSATFVGATPESGAEFMCGDYYFTWKTVDDDYYLVSQTLGAATNSIEPGSDLIPVDNIDDLESATIGTLSVPGVNEESDESLKAKWKNAKSGPSENGNKPHYKTWCESVIGIGRARILSLWGGENTVKAVLFSSDGLNVSDELVAKVQTYVDPIEDGFEVVVNGKTYTFGDGMGEGTANMGAHFLAVSSDPVNLTVTASVDIKDGYTIEAAQTSARAAIIAYLKKLALETSEDSSEIVRISSIGSIINGLEEIMDYDYSTLKINNQSENIIVDENSVAVLREVVLNAGA